MKEYQVHKPVMTMLMLNLLVISTSEQQLALSGYDVVACAAAATAGTPCSIIGSKNNSAIYTTLDIDGSPRFQSEFRFATPDNMIAFENSPFMYAPKYGGFCAWQLASASNQTGSKWSRDKLGPRVDLARSWRVLSREGAGPAQALYLFEDEDSAASFAAGLPATARAADALWKSWWGVHGTTPPYAIEGGPYNTACFTAGAAGVKERDCSKLPMPLPPAVLSGTRKGH